MGVGFLFHELNVEFGDELIYNAPFHEEKHDEVFPLEWQFLDTAWKNISDLNPTEN